MTRNLPLERSLLALFIASGFAGLIYQAIWSHYLGLTLGHAAYAQTLVLAIFMGGMALGAWLVSRYGMHWKRLIWAYAVVEGVIGLAGLAFHPVFLAYTGLSQETVLPMLDADWSISAWQWGSAAALILPQCVLLGMTFPLMSSGYLRVAPGADGEILGGLYFTNSLGAALGALTATFVLLPWIGMPGAVMIAGGINLLVAAAAFIIARRADVAGAAAAQPPAAAAADSTEPSRDGTLPNLFRALLAAAAISGGVSFIYEIGWVRLLNQSLGTTVHSFELMLASFILGLAFGGWWVRRNSRRISDAVSSAGYAQIAKGAAALISIPVFAQSFTWVGAMMGELGRTSGDYTLFSLGSAGISLLVMFPAAFFAGMTLPLFTVALLRHGAGEASIGKVYAANTLGSIAGVFLMVHLLIPMMGLRFALTLGALADIALGYILIRRFAASFAHTRLLATTAAVGVVVAFSLLAGKLDPRNLASGVFRHGDSTLGQDFEVHYLRDGKTATIALFTPTDRSVATIATNGKPDAGATLDIRQEPTEDEITMLMAAALPLASHPEPDNVAIIGWGSGLSTHTALGSPMVKRVDSIEIEPAMVEGARLFGARVARAYEDPRSIIHIDDARTYFSAGKKKFDIIISEPSNPWVSGVAGLFTYQFYEFLDSHLEEGGILVQWLQTYELDDRLLGTMLAALTSQFPYVDAYLTNSSDMLFMASASPLPALDYSRLKHGALQQELTRVGLGSAEDFMVRKIGSQDFLRTYSLLSGMEPHSDFYPTVSLQAPRSRFMGLSATIPLSLQVAGLPILEMLGERSPVAFAAATHPTEYSPSSEAHDIARQIVAAIRDPQDDALAARHPAQGKALATLRSLSSSTIEEHDIDTWLDAAATLSDATLDQLPAEDLEQLWIAPSWIDADIQPEVIQTVLRAYRVTAARDAARMHSAAMDALQKLAPTSPHSVREQMLVIAQLGSILKGDMAQVVELERGYGASVAPTRALGPARMFLLAWADTHGDAAAAAP